MTFRCDTCEDGGDIIPTVNTDGDWVLYCDSCGWWRYPTEQELRDILCIQETGCIPEFIKPSTKGGEHR